MTQLTLFYSSKHETAFLAFHEANPVVYAKLREFALQMKRSGRRHLGIAALFERLRWWSSYETVGDEYKLNNNFRAFYARMLMEREPELAGFFEIRRSVADDA
jgi:hypothetical protein